jgi:hypothetical protein
MRLLDRQVELLSYLTSSAAIFGDEPPPGPAPDGIDPALLRLEARLSYEKRIEKVTAALPRTFALLGSARTPILRAFVDACPPVDINQVANARRFHDFLAACWRHAPPDPPYLPDVAACELACATVRADLPSEEESKSAPDKDASPSGVRRHPRVSLLRCAYDVRPLFEEASWQTVPARRDTPVAVSVSTAGHPRVFDVTPAVFDLLAGLDDWVDAAALCTTRDADALVRELAEHNLLQVRWSR